MQASGRIWHVIETIDLDMYDAAERVREHRERKEPLKAAAEKERAMLSKRLVTPDKVKTITAFARDMSDFVMESVKGGVILRTRGVAVQDKCPFKWPAEMSLGQAAMVSDDDVEGPSQACRVGGPSAAR